MTDDIVARLRLWSDNAKEQDATEIVVGLRQAADEIERLRNERDEARRLYINEMCLRDYGDLNSRISEAKERGWNCFEGFNR